MMAAWLIALTGCIYAYVSCDLAWRGRYDLALAYAGYAFPTLVSISLRKGDR